MIPSMLEGKNIILRTVKEEDLKELYSHFDSIIMRGRFMSSDLISEHQFRLEFYETGFWSDAKGLLVIVYENRLIGAVWYEKQSLFDSLDLHFYIFRKEDRGHGLMSESLSLFSTYLFATKRQMRQQILVPDYSKAAIRVAQKCGFQFEGIARSAFFSRGEYLDLCIYSKLR